MKIIKRLSIFIVCCAFALCSSVSMLVNASYYSTVSPYSTYTFGISSSIKDTCYNYDYWVLCCQHYSVSSSSNNYYLVLVADESEETFGTEEGVLRFSTSEYPYNTKLNSLYTHYDGISTDYAESCYLRCNSSSTENSEIWFYNKYFFDSDESYMSGFIFDNYNVDKFPSYEGETSTYTSISILASNVDIYDYEGNLLQYGNYYTLLQYFNGGVDGSLITDYSGLETAPGVTESTESGSGDSSSEQLEVSNNILTNVKNIVKSIFDLPNAIANAIKGFFDSLQNGLIEGLKSLFIPSDNLFQDFKTTIESKFKFIDQITDLGEALINAEFGDEPPSNKLTIYGSTVEFMNWDLYEEYKELIDGIIIAVSYYFYIQKLIKRIPGVIGGFQKE